MSGRLIYVVGPSGAGKDSVLEYARTRLAVNAGIIFARRFITREPATGGEQHIPVSTSDFERLQTQGYFALNWEANGLSYGIGQEMCNWMRLGFDVVVNGSREYLPVALERYPDALVICITAPVETISNRLHQRARENAGQISERLRRATTLTIPSGHHVTTILNDGALETAGEALIQAFVGLKSIPRPDPAMTERAKQGQRGI